MYLNLNLTANENIARAVQGDGIAGNQVNIGNATQSLGIITLDA